MCRFLCHFFFTIYFYTATISDDEANNEAVGFTAYASTNRYYEFNNTVQFDTVITNYSSHYNTTTSIFQCPYNGLYSFSVGIYAGSSTPMRAEIWRNSQALLEVQADDIAGVNNQASGNIVTECYEGESVWIRASHDEIMFLYSDGGRSHFSGFLLYRFH